MSAVKAGERLRQSCWQSALHGAPRVSPAKGARVALFRREAAEFDRSAVAANGLQAHRHLRCGEGLEAIEVRLAKAGRAFTLSDREHPIEDDRSVPGSFAGVDVDDVSF